MHPNRVRLGLLRPTEHRSLCLKRSLVRQGWGSWAGKEACPKPGRERRSHEQAECLPDHQRLPRSGWKKEA